MRGPNKLATVLTCTGLLTLALTGLSAQEPAALTSHVAPVGQLYFYSIKDRPSFEEGYRRHLVWHAAHNDKLVWYAWTIDSSLRKADFVDGTFGATFAGLDARPDLGGDGADFGRNVAPYVSGLGNETWLLWPSASTATPLEDHEPGAILDVFFFEVDPGEVFSFENAVEKLGQASRNTAKLTWYRVSRASHLPMYILLLSRKSWADIEAAGPTLDGLLTQTYAARPAQVSDVLRHARSIHVETWHYEPRLTLLPGRPLEP